ncbi:MAG TPA: ABC transporter substrate-binding protein [Devosiaceae bacterium]
MKRFLAAALAVAVLCGSALAGTVKVGVIGPFSGPFALAGKNFKAGIDAYMALNGASVDGNDVEIVYRDLPQPDPAKSAALAQELVVKQGVQYLAGFYFTPNAMAAAALTEPGNVPMVIFNAATSSIVEKSPFVVRTSFTMWQNTLPMTKVAFERGMRRVATVVSDYGPGIDAENAFRTGFAQQGGAVVDSVRLPLSTTDFSAIMQRIKDSGADAVFAFLPSGPPTLGFVRASEENGLKAAGVTLLATGDLTQEPDLAAYGDSALGLLTTYHYSIAHDSPENLAFVAAGRAAIGNPGDLTFPAVGAFDGMHVIYAMIAATGGQKNASVAVDAVRGMAWTSPRGPVSIDPATRHITQNVYLREVAKAADGTYYNREIETFAQQGDPGLMAQ